VAASRYLVGIPGDLSAHDRERLAAAGIESDPDWRVGRFAARPNGDTEPNLDDMTPVARVEAPSEDEAIRRVAEALGRPPVGFVAWPTSED
jgi:hypothetical protein